MNFSQNNNTSSSIVDNHAHWIKHQPIHITEQVSGIQQKQLPLLSFVNSIYAELLIACCLFANGYVSKWYENMEGANWKLYMCK